MKGLERSSERACACSAHHHRLWTVRGVLLLCLLPRWVELMAVTGRKGGIGIGPKGREPEGRTQGSHYRGTVGRKERQVLQREEGERAAREAELPECTRE